MTGDELFCAEEFLVVTIEKAMFGSDLTMGASGTMPTETAKVTARV